MRTAILPALLLAACQPGEPIANNQRSDAGTTTTAQGGPDTPVSSDDPEPSRRAPDGPTPDCPIIESNGWHAHVDATSGPRGEPRLTVSGRVTVPTGGYRIEWGDMRVAESYPVQIFADLLVIPPTGAATQVITTHEVRGEWPMDQPVGAFTVGCGNRVLARLSPVASAH